MREKCNFLKTLGKKAKMIITCAVAVVILIAVLLIVIFAPEGGTTFDAEASLREVLEISDLSTAEYTYNTITEVKNDKETKYYVSYEGKVRAGFDIEQIEIIQDGDKVTIIIPSITIHTVEINEDSMDYIFVKSKFNTENTFAEAINECKKDLKEKAEENNTFRQTAMDSARDIITALTKPFLSEITINVEFIDEMSITDNQEEVAQ